MGGDDPVFVFFTDRPTQEYIKSYGPGEYTLFNAEGKMLRRFHITLNRNGNLKVASGTPDGLSALSTLNLQRLAKQYIRIVKVWPAKANDAKAIQREINFRDTLVEALDTDRESVTA